MKSNVRALATPLSALNALAVVGVSLLAGTPRLLAAATLVAVVWWWSSASRRPSPLIPAWALVAYTVIEEHAEPAVRHGQSRHELMVAAALVLAWALGAGRQFSPTRAVTRQPDGGSGRARSTAQTCRS